MKNLLTALVLVAMAAITFIAVRSCSQQEREYQSLSDAYEAALKEGVERTLEPIRTITDTVYKKSSATVKPVETTDLSVYVSKGYADTIKKALDIAVKDIDRKDRFIATLQDSIEGLLTVDTNGTRWASLKDNVFDIRYNFDTNVWYPKVTLDFDIIGHRYKPNFFARRQVLTTIIASDPRVHIGNIRSVNRITLPSRFGLDLTAGVMMTPHGLTYGVGAGIGYRIKEF